MIEFLAAATVWFLAWALVGAGWRSRRLESTSAAALLSITSLGSLAVYSLTRQDVSAVLVVGLILFASVVFLVARYTLRVFANDRTAED